MKKKRSFDWITGGFLISYQALLLIGLPFYYYFNRPSLALYAIAFVLLYIAGMSVTTGYHRYFSHRTYKAHPVVETFLLFFGSMAIQSSALRWSHDHRLHHAHVDTDDDPYSINKGFWYAHFFWMLRKAPPINKTLVSDLLQNPRVVLQDRFIALFMFGSNALVWLLVGWLFHDFLGAFVITVALRVFVLHHLTWFINSLAHTWGDKPFCQEQTAVNNHILSLLTFGEGYHNYHHVFAKDYRNGVRWFHFDPSKWLIWMLSKLGLTRDLRRVDKLTIQKRIVTERKALLIEKVRKLNYIKQADLEQEIETISNKMVEKLTSWYALCKELKQPKQPELVTKIQQELAALSVDLKEDWRKWRVLSKTIFKLKPGLSELQLIEYLG